MTTRTAGGVVGRVAHVVDGATDAAFVLFAVATLAYDLDAFLGWSVVWLAVFTVIGVAVAAVVWRMLRARSSPPTRDAFAMGPMSRLAPVVAAAVAVSAVAAIIGRENSSGWWPIAWVMLIVLTGAVVVLAYRKRPTSDPGSEPRDDVSVDSPAGRALAADAAPVLGHVLAFVTAIFAAVASLFLVRYSPDDIYYVNRATWVAQHGIIPLRDTMFGNQAFSSPNGEKVPVSSIEALQGAIARALGVQAPTVVYFLTTAVATALAVWMLWRLLRSWVPARRVVLAFVLGCVYLAWDGWEPRTLGNFHLVRLWQGKSVFVSVVVAAIFVHLTRWLRLRRPQDAAMLFVLGVCSVGLTSSAVFVVPMIAIVGAAACVLLRQRGFTALGLLAVYPVLAGVVILALEQGEGAPPHFLPPARVVATIAIGTGAFAFVGWLAVTLGPLSASDSIARALALSSVVAFLVLMAPGVHDVIARLSGAGPVIWRETWILPLPGLVGMLAAIPIPSPARVPRWAIAAAASAVVVVLVVAGGEPLWSSRNHVRRVSSPVWKLPHTALVASRAIAALGPVGGPVLASEPVMGALAITTTRVYALVPRRLYTQSVPLGPHGRHDRVLLTEWASTPGRVLSRNHLDALLRGLRVAEICLLPRQTGKLRVAAELGYATSRRAGPLECAVR